jgi:hypothetical protein
MKHRDILLFIIIFSVTPTSCTAPKIITAETKYVATVTDTHTPTNTHTKTITPTPEVNYSKIDIFNESTWPKNYKIFWENGWYGSKDLERIDFHNFVEKTRMTFFEKEGISDVIIELSHSKQIDQRFLTLWGMVYWTQTHRDEVKKNHTYLFLTPTEHEWITSDESVGNTNHPGTVNSLIFNDFSYDLFYSDSQWGQKNPLNSDRLGVISGKDGLVTIPHGVPVAIYGDGAAVAVVGGGEKKGYVMLMSFIGWKDEYKFAAPAIPIDGKIFLPAGTACRTNEVSFDKDEYRVFKIPNDLDYGYFETGGKPGSFDWEDYYFQFVGNNFGFDTNWWKIKTKFNLEYDYYCMNPILAGDYSTGINAMTPGSPDNYPWSKK